MSSSGYTGIDAFLSALSFIAIFRFGYAHASDKFQDGVAQSNLA